MSATMTNGYHHVAMKVADLDKSIAFYAAIGMPVAASWGEGDGRAVMIDCGNSNYLELFAGGAAGEKPAGFVTHFAFRVADTAACLAAAVAAGAVVTMDIKTLTIPSKPKEIPVCLAFCKGPDGEIIEFFQEL